MINEMLERMRSSSLCGENAYISTTTLRYEFDRATVTVANVPVIVCPESGEELVPGPIGVAIGDIVHKIAETARLMRDHAEGDETVPFETHVTFPANYQSLTPI